MYCMKTLYYQHWCIIMYLNTLELLYITDRCSLMEGDHVIVLWTVIGYDR